MKIGRIVLIVIAVLVIWHVGGNIMARGNPPAACQLLGGRWSLISGWHCG